MLSKKQDTISIQMEKLDDERLPYIFNVKLEELIVFSLKAEKVMTYEVTTSREEIS